MSTNHYKVLGLEETASKDEIKKAFRSLSLKYHPDRNPNNKDAVDKFQEINNSYEVLSDEQKKREYDMMRKNPFFNLGGNDGQDINMEDLLGSLFGAQMGMGMPFFPPNMGQGFSPGMGLPPGMKIHVMRGGPQSGFHSVFNQIQKPPSINKTISITMEQVFSGATIPVEIERFIMESNIKIYEKETIYITVPKGVDDGEIITIKDKGNTLDNNNKGDIKIFIKVENNTSYERNGIDLLTNKTISLKEALCGFKIDLKYINGKVYTLYNSSGNIIVPNYKKIIPNMGLTRDGHTGDLIITFTIDFPSHLPEEKMAQLRELL
jgi:DnaJ-class molecular chaperone